jgi:hypothetical protein
MGGRNGIGDRNSIDVAVIVLVAEMLLESAKHCHKPKAMW